MKLYRTCYTDSGDMPNIVWSASLHMAKHIAARIKKTSDKEELGDFIITQVEVPTKRKELVGWLNNNCNFDTK